MTKKIIGLFIIFISCMKVSSPDYLNLDFETSIHNSNYPDVWDFSVEGYKIELDTIKRTSGIKSLKIFNHDISNKTVGTFVTPLSIDFVKNKSVVLNGSIKTAGLTNGFASLLIRIEDVKGNIIGFDNMSTYRVIGDSEWKSVSIGMKIPNEAYCVFIGGEFSGSGEAWFDDFEILVDGSQYQNQETENGIPSKEELLWLKKHIRPISTIDPFTKDSKDIDFLKEVIGDSKIVALGEATHGTKEIFLMKHRLIKFFVEKMNFSTFSIEANMPESYKLNEYIIEGKGNPKDYLERLYFWTWNTEEMLDMVEWMKKYNSISKEEILFTGFDMQYREGAFEVLKNNLDANDSILLDTFRSRLDMGAMIEVNTGVVPSKNSVSGQLNQIRNLVLSAAVSEAERKWLLQNLIIIEQSISYPSASQRDQYMAENLSWIEQNNLQSKIVLWAHNGHVKKTGNAMGAYLAKRYKNDYLSIGFAFHNGFYSARGPNGLKSYQAQESYPGTFEFYFKSINEPIFMLDMRKLKNNSKASNWLFKELDFRIVGANKLKNEFYKSRIIDDFDILIFIDESSASELLVN